MPEIVVRALASLAGFAPPGGRLTVSPGETVGAVAARLGFDPAAIGTILVNDRPAEADTPITPGDTVLFIPPITGG